MEAAGVEPDMETPILLGLLGFRVVNVAKGGQCVQQV